MKKINIIGLMSGTSLDGVDLVLAQFWFDKKWEFEMICAETIDYDSVMLSDLQKATQLSGLALAHLNVDLGRTFGMMINKFCESHNIDKNSVDAIASHGHTVFHQPNQFLTMQIGCGAQIAGLTGIKTICDFRTLDVALGGQGAPLVPIGDALLFSEFDYCLNIGGIANVSFNNEGRRVSFDICLANMVSNYLVNQLGQEYDKNGENAKKGQLNSELLQKINDFDYFSLHFPKSLGKEFFEDYFKPLLDSYSCSVEDKLHTFGVHFITQLSNVIGEGSLLITGGGAYNSFWIEGFKKQKPRCVIAATDEQLINFKEGLIFGFLGVLRLKEEVNSLATVTGASKNSIGGAIYLA